jgi:hydroxymethylpyrimidine pyrophosphatase-like HAD family hydrolase
MRYQVLASDYDGTLAHNGRVDEPTVAALEKLLATGRRLVLVTGRELPELLQVFPRIDLFEMVVAENGALLYRPATKEEKPLAEPPPAKFIAYLKENKVWPMSVGRVIVATWEPHEKVVLDGIRKLGLELQVIFNKGAVMILPASVNKASGLSAALDEMGLSPHNAVGVGDAENDHALLRLCEFSAAVANALPALKETADIVTKADHGAGVAELIEKIVATDLAECDGRLKRHHLPLGESDAGAVMLSPYGPGVLISGPSASGKSTAATAIVEALAEHGYQFCIIDPEGDYETFAGAAVFGGPQGPPAAEEVLKLLEKPGANAVVSMTGMPIADRPPFFLGLFPRLLQMRGRTGRPHWIVLDEAHHLLPAEWQPPANTLPDELRNILLVTVHPNLLAKTVLERIGTVLAVGPTAAETLTTFAEAAGTKLAKFKAPEPAKGELLLWKVEGNAPPVKVRPHPPKTERRRHRRKYAEGELPPDRSFYFRGPEEKLNIRAQNLILFLQLADGVDDETWEHHLHNGDYAKWFREGIKDDSLAAEAERIAGLPNIGPTETRKLIRTAVERDYTLPAAPPLPVPGAS